MAQTEQGLPAPDFALIEAMSDAAFIGGDWGTTRARFWLCDEGGRVLDACEGRGAAEFDGNAERFSAHFNELTAHWPATIPAVLCGTVGANIGWQDAGYAQTPFALNNPGNCGARLDENGRTIIILAGVKGVNPIGEIDVMRGEETQLVGACQSEAIADAIFALPGTHNKWVRVSESNITSLMSSMSGEVFAALSRFGVLVNGDQEPRLGPVFEDGVKVALKRGGADLLSLLFVTRSRCATGQLADEDASSFLSGIIIGADVASASGAMGMHGSGPIRLIGEEGLAARYACALHLAGHESMQMSGENCARIGLTAAWRRFFR